MNNLVFDGVEQSVYLDLGSSKILLFDSNYLKSKYGEITEEVVETLTEVWNDFCNSLSTFSNSAVTTEISNIYSAASTNFAYLKGLSDNGKAILDLNQSTTIKGIEKSFNITNGLFIAIGIINDKNDGETWEQAIASQSLGYFSSYAISAFITGAGIAAGISGGWIAVAAAVLGTAAWVSADKIVDIVMNPDEREDFFSDMSDVINAFKGTVETDFIIDGNPITISVDSNSESTYKGNIETISKLWELGSDNIDGFEAIYDDYTFKYDKSNEAIIINELGDLILNGEDAILKFLDSFPDLLSESVVLTDGIKEYKLEKHDFLSGLINESFSLEELLELNPSLKGKIFANSNGIFFLYEGNSFWNGTDWVTDFESLPNIKLPFGIAGTEIDLEDLMGETMEEIRDAFHKAEQTKSPLILDLDGDGVETTSLENGAYFDHDDNNFAEQTTWVNRIYN